MTILNPTSANALTIAKGGVLPSLFYGRRVSTISGFDKDPTEMVGYRRHFHGRTRAVRPGAYSPHTTHVRVNHDAPSTVGTVNVLGGIDALVERNLKHGVAGSRAAYGRHAPRKAGVGSQLGFLQTPAAAIFETSMARTGGAPVLYSKFAAPAGMTPNGMSRFDPVPGYTRIPLGYIVAPPPPIPALPGTPGAFTRPGGSYGQTQFTPWWMAQNQGQVQAGYVPGYQPLPPPPSYMSSPLSQAPTDEIPMPLELPGSQHTISVDGSPTYGGAPGYPAWDSPFGSAGSSRTPSMATPASGADAVPARKSNAGLALLAVGALAYFVMKAR